MKLILGSDHAAFAEKQTLKAWLKDQYEIVDVGCPTDERCDYPTYATAVVKEVLGQKTLGILLCGSGIGVSMVANRYAGVRAALCRTPREAELSKQHNNANVLCLGARLHTIDELKAIITAWLESSFEGGRHLDRVNLFDGLGEKA